MHRDEVTDAHLEALGWHVITIWECELRKNTQLEVRLDSLAEQIRNAGEAKKVKDLDKRQSRAAAKREREELLRKQAELEAEINRLYPIPASVRKESMVGL